jgi:hypothetical protein
MARPIRRLGGTSLAARHYLINSTSQINPKVLKKLKGNTGPPGKTGPTGPAGAAGLAGAKGLEGGKGLEGQRGQSALSPLPSGQSESGDYGIYTPNTKTSGFLNISVGFPIPLGAPLPEANTEYTTTTTPHCSGPGHAERGFLCVYSGNRGRVSTPPVILYFETGTSVSGAGRFGFDMQWTVTGEEAFDVGTYTVTAP